MSDFSLTQAGRIDANVQHSAERREQVGRLFETMFIQQMLKRDQPFADDERSRLMEESAGERTAKELLHMGLAEHAAGGLGVDDLLLERISALEGRGS